MAEYTSERLEYLISSAIDRLAPDLRIQAAEAAVTAVAAPDGIVPIQTTRKSTSLRRSVMGLAACLILILGLGAFTFFGTHSIIGIDVNPSMEITVNYFDRVLNVRPLNSDAFSVIGDMNLKYVNLDIAVNALVGSMALQGYFTAGEDVAVLVSVSGGSPSHNTALQKKLALDIETAATTVGARAAVYTQSVDEDSSQPPQPTATVPVATPPVSTPAVSSLPVPPPVSPSPPPVSPSPSPVPSDSSPDTAPLPSPPSPSVSVPVHRPATAQERAAKNGISYGKQVFIDKLLTLDPALNEQELAAMPIGKLASLVKQRGWDLSLIVDYDPDDSTKENIEDFIDDLDDDDEDDEKKPDNTNHKGWEKNDETDDEDDD